MPRQKKETSAAVLGFEDKLWQAAVLMRGKLPATQYRQVLMGLLFLRYVSDAFEKRFGELKAEGYGDEEDRDAEPNGDRPSLRFLACWRGNGRCPTGNRGCRS